MGFLYLKSPENNELLQFAISLISNVHVFALYSNALLLFYKLWYCQHFIQVWIEKWSFDERAAQNSITYFCFVVKPAVSLCTMLFALLLFYNLRFI